MSSFKNLLWNTKWCVARTEGVGQYTTREVLFILNIPITFFTGWIYHSCYITKEEADKKAKEVSVARRVVGV
jgi:hypothetical protein